MAVTPTTQTGTVPTQWLQGQDIPTNPDRAQVNQTLLNMAGGYGTNAPGVQMTEAVTGVKQDRAGLVGGVHGRVGGPRGLGGVSWAQGQEGQDALRKYGMGPLSTEEVGPDEYFTPGQTVENRLQGLLEDKSNPLMQRRESQAMQQAQSRGLLNSTMAATAGQAAMIDAAMPIASQDAATLNRFYQAAQMADITKDQQTWQHNLQTMMNQQNFDHETQQWVNNSFTDLAGNWTNNMTAIMTNKGLSAAERQAMLKQGNDWVNSSIKTMAELNSYQYEL